MVGSVLPAGAWWPAAHTAAAAGFQDCSHSQPGRWRWPDPMASSPSPQPEPPDMTRTQPKTPCRSALPVKPFPRLPFHLLLQDHFPDRTHHLARRPPRLPPPPSPGAGRSQSGLRLCWCHPSPSLSPGAGAAGGARGARAPCRPEQPTAVRGWALGPPWGKGGARGGCLMFGTSGLVASEKPGAVGAVS